MTISGCQGTLGFLAVVDGQSLFGPSGPRNPTQFRAKLRFTRCTVPDGAGPIETPTPGGTGRPSHRPLAMPFPCHKLHA